MAARSLQKSGPSGPNTVTFPRHLRDAIPDQELCAGRCLALESVDAHGAHIEYSGRRVRLLFRVKETGRLSGVFDIVADLDLDAAEALATLIHSAAEQARKAPASPKPTRIYVRKRNR